MFASRTGGALAVAAAFIIFLKALVPFHPESPPEPRRRRARPGRKVGLAKPPVPRHTGAAGVEKPALAASTPQIDGIYPPAEPWPCGWRPVS